MFVPGLINLPGYCGCALLPVAGAQLCMSQSPMASATDHYADPSAEQVRRIDAETSIQELLDVLDDAGCRAILNATSDSALSAHEISETCELPLSTTYRKLDLLTDAGFLEERTRIRRAGKHTSEYFRSVTDVVVSISTPGNIELQVSHRENSEKAEPSVSTMEE